MAAKAGRKCLSGQYGEVAAIVTKVCNELSPAVKATPRRTPFSQSLHTRSDRTFRQTGASAEGSDLSISGTSLYYAQGRYEEAEPLFVRSLSMREQQLAPTIPMWLRAFVDPHSDKTVHADLMLNR